MALSLFVGTRVQVSRDIVDLNVKKGARGTIATNDGMQAYGVRLDGMTLNEAMTPDEIEVLYGEHRAGDPFVPEKERIVTEIEGMTGLVVVSRYNPGTYMISVDGIARHPNLDAEGVMRALSNYLMSACYLMKKMIVTSVVGE